ncbi:MAG: ribosome small subunit-dependent GTPase A [Acidimicrobiia bacterium]
MTGSLAALAPYGADDRVAALFDSYAGPDLVPGRIARVDRDRSVVATVEGMETATSDDLPAVGDWVALRPPDTEGLAKIETILPRWSELSRRGSGPTPRPQVVAANVDVAFIVVGLDRDPSLNRIERELVVAWESGARPVVVLNKADATEDAEGEGDTVRDRIGLIDVVVVSAKTGAGIDALTAALRPALTAVLLGPSGVGKSTLVNAIVGADVAITREVRESDHRGRHTTTARSLLPVPGGGVLLDTPGVRSISLWDVEDGIAMTFPEIEELVDSCRFGDCAHDAEPDCAVKEALAAGRIDPARVESWDKLQRELAYEARSVDPKLAAEEKQKWKAIRKAIRAQSRP